MSNDPRGPCVSCGLCCRSYVVPLFEHDRYRLVRKRNSDPRSSTFISEQEQPDNVGFRLRSTGATCGIALDKEAKLQGEPSWIAYIRRARNVIDEFFPGVPPLPFAHITIER